MIIKTSLCSYIFRMLVVFCMTWRVTKINDDNYD